MGYRPKTTHAHVLTNSQYEYLYNPWLISNTSNMPRLNPLRSLDIPDLARQLKWLFWLASLMLIAYWISAWLSPRPVASLMASSAATVSSGPNQIGRIFGVQAGPATIPSDLNLTGIYQTTSGGGFATFRTAEGARSAQVGGEILPGLVLRSVDRTHVIVSQGGIEKQVDLPGKTTAADTLTQTSRTD